MPGKTDTNSIPADTSRFATTHWSLVLAAGSPESTRYHEALEVLCRTYWYPLYAYLRRHGSDTHDAAEHTQAFFAKMLEKKSLAKLCPQGGKFRSFLLTALKRFVGDERERMHAQKRGGDRHVLSINIEDAESKYKLQPIDRLSPDKLFERSWALTVLNRVMNRLMTEMDGVEKRQLFDQARAHLCGTCDAIPYRELAVSLDMTEGAVKAAIHRMRNRYRDILYEEILQTVSSPAEVDEEIRGLFSALSY
jgi:RNA polymerase sigma factor (sigma-70 family)